MEDGNLNLPKAGEESSEAEGKRERDWQVAVKEMELIRDILDQKAMLIYGAEGVFWLAPKKAKFAETVRDNNEDWKEYAAYHILLAGSTTPREKSPKLDLSEPYSARDFCFGLITELALIANRNKK